MISSDYNKENIARDSIMTGRVIVLFSVDLKSRLNKVKQELVEVESSLEHLLNKQSQLHDEKRQLECAIRENDSQIAKANSEIDWTKSGESM